MISEWGVTPVPNRVVIKYKVVHLSLFNSSRVQKVHSIILNNMKKKKKKLNGDHYLKKVFSLILGDLPARWVSPSGVSELISSQYVTSNAASKAPVANPKNMVRKLKLISNTHEHRQNFSRGARFFSFREGDCKK